MNRMLFEVALAVVDYAMKGALHEVAVLEQVAGEEEPRF